MGPVTVLKEARQRVSAPRERYAETVREQTEADEWAPVGTARRATRGRTSLAVALGALLHLVDIVGDQLMGFLVHACGLPPTGQLRPERVAIRATTSEPAVTSPAATTRRTAIGGRVGAASRPASGGGGRS